MPTNEQRAFWSAIWANPLDDTPRLIYADWLQEHGDEARAEFIRVQVELAKLGPDRQEARKPRLLLEEREVELLGAHHAAWHAPVAAAFCDVFPNAPRNLLAEWTVSRGFRRGFAIANFLQLTEIKLFALAETVEPLESVRVRIDSHERNPSGVEALAEWGGSNSVVELVIAGATDEDVSAIVRNGQFRQLSQLHLIHGSVTDAGVRELLSWRFVAGLCELDLMNNPITNAGARALAESPHLTQLAHLNLFRIPFARDARSELQRAFSGLTLEPEA